MSNPFIVHEGERIYLSLEEVERLQKLDMIQQIRKNPARRGDLEIQFALTVPYEQIEKLLELR